MEKSNLSFSIFPFECGKESKIYEDLKSVTDTQYQMILFDKCLKFFPQMSAKTVGIGVTGARVIAVCESARKSQDLVFFKLFFIFDKVVDMNNIGFCASCFKGELSFCFTV